MNERKIERRSFFTECEPEWLSTNWALSASSFSERTMAFDFLNDYKGMGIFELNYMILDVRFYMFDIKFNWNIMAKMTFLYFKTD